MFKRKLIALDHHSPECFNINGNNLNNNLNILLSYTLYYAMQDTIPGLRLLPTINMRLSVFNAY